MEENFSIAELTNLVLLLLQRRWTIVPDCLLSIAIILQTVIPTSFFDFKSYAMG